MTIELRLSRVDPPAPDPPRTLYRDIVNLPDPVRLGITVRYFNYDSVTLYFRITGSAAGYTFGTVNLGALGAGTNAYINLDEFASRAKPATEVYETINLILSAYTDAGYTNLKWTFTRNVTVKFINSADPSYTVDFLNNFDDGTVQGWAAVNENNNDEVYPQVVSDYVLSAPYSLRMYQSACGTGTGQKRARLYKSFTTPNRNTVYAIMDVRLGEQTADEWFIKNLKMQIDATVLVYLGKPYDTSLYHYVPKKWMRIVVPLPKNTTLEIRLVDERYARSTCTTYKGYLWLDDFKIISK